MINQPCPHCGGQLQPSNSIIEHWKCQSDQNHVGSYDAPGKCPDCELQGRHTVLSKVTMETHGYACEDCGKSPLEAVMKESWLSVEYEPETPTLKSVFVPDNAQRYGANLAYRASSIQPCNCDPRWGLIRIGYATDITVKYVDGCCEDTIDALRGLAEQ